MPKTEYAVPHQVYFDAKHYVEQKRIIFFDFVRNCAFGFIRIGEKKGHFAHLVMQKDGDLECQCNCSEADYDEVCGHGFALYLKMLNWPFEKKDHSERFEKEPITQFFKNAGRRFYNETLSDASNPSFVYPEDTLEPRLSHYWNFTEGEGMVLKRDRQCLEKAKRLTRDKSELSMIKKGFPPARALFEDSFLYNICKLFYHLQTADDLVIKADLLEDHQVRLQLGTYDNDILSWQMPIETWLKGIQKDWDYWQDKANFPMHKQGMPILYRIGFIEDNSLEIEPMIEVSTGKYQPMDSLLLPKSRNLYFHENLGYFRIQTGLSHFEMEYGVPGIHHVDHQDVKRFLSEHRDTLQTLDRTLIDDSIFGEVVAEHFDRFIVTLLDFEDATFAYALEARLGSHTFTDEDLRALFKGRGRYRKLAGKLFDATGYDGVFLKPLYESDEKGQPRLHVGELFRLMTFFRERIQIDTNELTAKVYEQLQNYSMGDLPSLEHTQLALRDYQKHGYEWLYFLKSFGLGGLLCDQMGLGKTHQSMALIAAVLAEKPDARAVVIAPSSVIYHWRDKLRAFCPGLRIGIHHGSDRNVRGMMRRAQVIISTYATMRNDFELFDEYMLDLVVYDEIQALKNKGTKLYRTLSNLRSMCKIGLTGTPIENHVVELKALLDIVFPGYLGGDIYFKKYFANPIILDQNQETAEKVRAMINPFLLRRSKSQVLLELPEKTEDLRKIKFEKYQEELYNEIKSQGKDELDGDKGLLHVFTLINKLKQICNHPALYFKNDDYTDYPSAKWDTFTELLDESLDSGEKIVVFTQYLGMIEIFKKYLASKSVQYACITGATKERDREQKRFMNDPNCRVFIGTLQSSGVGIDLTSASILIHYDRWWNPAREEQATDRIHRIGQKKNVQIYKFMTQDTVEERINQIISRKRALLDDVIGFDDESIRKTLSMDELLEILA